MKRYIMMAVLAVFSANVYGADLGGEYKRYRGDKPDKDQAVIKIKELQSGRVQVEGSAVWVGNAASGNVNTGELDGTFPLSGNVVRYTDGDDASGCRLTITFSENALRVSGDNMNCGGQNVTFNGDYRKTGGPKPAASAGPQQISPAIQFAREFYDVFYAGYKKYLGGKNRTIGDFKKLFEPKNYFTGALSSLLISSEQRQLASPGELVGLDFDPFTGAQDEAGKAIIGEAKLDGVKTQVPVTFSMFPKHKVILELSSGQNGLAISNILYPDEKTDLTKILKK